MCLDCLPVPWKIHLLISLGQVQSSVTIEIQIVWGILLLLPQRILQVLSELSFHRS